MRSRKFSSATGSPSTNAVFGIETPMGRTPLQGASLGVTSPRAKAAGLFCLERFAVIGKCPNSSGRCKQRPSSGLRGPPLSVPGKAARAGTPAPQCGTGVLVRQIVENGLEIGQTPGASLAAARYPDSQPRNWFGRRQTPC